MSEQSSDKDRASSPEKRSGGGKRYSSDRRGNRSRDKNVDDQTQATGDKPTNQDSVKSLPAKEIASGDSSKLGTQSIKNANISDNSSKDVGPPKNSGTLVSDEGISVKTAPKVDRSSENHVSSRNGSGDRKSEKGGGGKYGETRWGPRQSLEKSPTKTEGNLSKEKDSDKATAKKTEPPSSGANSRRRREHSGDKPVNKERESKTGSTRGGSGSSRDDGRRTDRARSGKADDGYSRSGRNESSTKTSSSRDERSSHKDSRRTGQDESKEKTRSTKERSEVKPTRAELEAKKAEEEKKKRQLAEKKKLDEKVRQEEEKRRQEEDKVRREEEKKKAEEEKKRREEEEAKRLLDEEKRFITEFAAESGERVETKTSYRDSNYAASEKRPDDSFFVKLDSSLKKNTAFVKKLKNMCEAQKDALTKDFNSLNLTKYIGEVASAIVEAKLKMSDIGCAVHICSLLHQRYAEFSPTLLENWHKALPSKKDEKITNLSKLRVDLRLFAELVTAGVFRQKEGLGVLANQLSILTVGDKDEHNNLPIILSFCKHCGDDYAGLLSRRCRLLSEKYKLEIVRSQFLPPERQKACRNLVVEYYHSLSRHLLQDHKELKGIEKHNRRTLHSKGELSSERKEQYETLVSSYQKLLTNTQTFSDILDEEMPDLPEDDLKSDADGLGFDIFNPLKNADLQYEGDASLFEDEETRMFYENLPDLKVLVPAILYKDSAGSASNVEDDKLEQDMEDVKLEDVEKEMEEAEKSSMESEEVKETDEQKEEEEVEEEEPEIIDGEEEEGENNTKVLLENFLTTLPNCVNREMIDKAAVEFCMKLNTKANRHKLVRALFKVQRTRYDLLPFYSRLVATLFPCMPDVANDLVYSLKGDMKWHMKKKDQINIESKLKTIRFIGEMVKFKMFPKSEALHILKTLLFDFKHHNIEMACALLDIAGRFLYRSPESHLRTKIYLDIIMRKKATLHLDERYNTMIENAFYYSNPPDVPYFTKKERPPMHEYIRKLLFKDLSKSNTEKVLRQIRKLNWDDTEIASYCTKCLTSVWNMRYNNIHCAANLLAGLAAYYDKVAITVVDSILEDIRLGMEINLAKFNQRRVSTAKFVGELYNYRMVESSVIFKILYSFITFGVSLDESMPSPLDPPEHLFRIRLVCILLDTCGQYFDRGSSKKKLDYFLLYFQRYYLFKKKEPVFDEERLFPIDVRNLVEDTLEGIRPKFELAESYELACALVLSLEKAFREKLAGILPITETEDQSDGDTGLHTIPEAEEDLSLSQLQITDEGTAESEDERDRRSSSQPANHRHIGSDEDEESESESDVIDSAGEDENDDNIVVLKAGPRHIECEEDTDFLGQFDKMMVDTIHARSQESVKVPTLDIAVPMHLRGSHIAKQQTNNVPILGIFSTNLPVEEEAPVEEEQSTKGAIKFVLMTRKGNKQHFSDLNVPISAEFASKFREREEAEQAEKAQMKRVVLDMHERQEEEDYQELMASLVKPVQQPVYNRERKVNYKHPKGVPDADSIFGSSYKGKR